MQKLNGIALAGAFGIAWAAVMLFLGWFSSLMGGGRLVEVLSFLYKGFDSTFLGGIIGALWGFVSGFIWGGMIAFVYNKTIWMLKREEG